LRIAYFAYADLSKPGAPPIHVDAIAGGLASKGHEVSLIIPDRCGPFEIDSVKTVRLSHKTPTSIGWAGSAGRWLSENANQFDIVYLRDFYSSNAIINNAKRNHLPSVLEINGNVGKERSSGPIPLRYRILAEIELNFYLKKRLKKADKIIVVAPGLIDELAPKAGGREKFELHPNGVDTALFAPSDDKKLLRRELGLSENGPLLGAVGSILPYHVECPLIEAIEELSRDFAGLSFIFVGDGPGREDVEKKIDNSSIKNRIKMIGPVDIEQSAKYIASLDLALAWSTSETAASTWPVRLSAYSACGIPIVGPDWGTYTFFQDAGVLQAAEGGTAIAIAQVASRILRNPEIAEEMSRKGRKLAIEQLSWNSIVDKTELLLSKLSKTRN